jgi:hypothetical protein
MAVTPCPPSPAAPVRGIVTFSPTAFKVLYPQFVTVADPALTMNFALSELFLNNSCCSVVTDANKRETLLNLLVAHITQLFNGINGAIPGGLVGRIDSATEGSDSITASFPENPNGAWFMQTPFGAMFWAATAYLRTFRYIPPPAVCADFPTSGFPIVGPGGGCC